MWSWIKSYLAAFKSTIKNFECNHYTSARYYKHQHYICLFMLLAVEGVRSPETLKELFIINGRLLIYFYYKNFRWWYFRAFWNNYIFGLHCILITASSLDYGKFEMLTAVFAEMLGFARKPWTKICMYLISMFGHSKKAKWLLTKMVKLNIYFINREKNTIKQRFLKVVYIYMYITSV